MMFLRVIYRDGVSHYSAINTKGLPFQDLRFRFPGAISVEIMSYDV
jgi:hypothetical protein